MHLNGENCQNIILREKTNRKWVNGLKIYDSKKTLDPRGWSATTPGEYTCILPKYSKAFFSETAWPMKAKRQVEHPYSLYEWSRSYNQDGRHGYN